MTEPLSVLAIAIVCLTTLTLGALGLRLAKGTSDFYVAGRTVTPWRNASAIGGEYLSAASYLGVAGLVYDQGIDMLWMPIGYTIGYLVLLILVAAPLRRSGAYTLPDFAEARLESRALRRGCALLVVGIGWLYLLPQMQGAGLALRHVSGLPTWVGATVLTVIVVLNVAAGGMRSVTLVQSVQYWIKLTAIAVPAFVLLLVWHRSGSPTPQAPASWWEPLTSDEPTPRTLFTTYSTLAALCLGTMGLPHIAVRFYTNPDGVAARRTTVSVLALLSIFYVFPPVYGYLGRAYLDPVDTAGDPSRTVVLALPGAMLSGLDGQLLTALVAAGAFAAFLATASGVAMSVAGAIDQDVLRPLTARLTQGDATPSSSFRLAAMVGVLAPFVTAVTAEPIGISSAVGHAFAIAAATFAPLLILGVWWTRLTAKGAAAGVLVGGTTTSLAAIVSVLDLAPEGWPGALVAAPTAWATPLAVVVAIVASLLTPGSRPRRWARTMTRLHTPEDVLAEAR
ncbi:cation acetate symporter [Janibacter hoylei]|uniref:sodium/solute symporter n=1 Tax=Janibacter hoylei TaxID=364298 RepID=UPI002238ED7F|nr:cation acetate symporter [Janibacter hoylei]MCW4601318.1 cation acetate symporter [Janibacter hoylei]